MTLHQSCGASLATQEEDGGRAENNGRWTPEEHERFLKGKKKS